MWWTIGWRMFRQEMRRGELNIILAAIVLSVAAVLSLSLFSARLQSALVEQSATFIAGDRELSAGRPVDDSWLQQAREYGLAVAQQKSMRSMLFANGRMELSDVRAAGQGYPLKGDIEVADEPFGNPYVVDALPEPGTIWIDSRLFQVLGVQIDDSVEIGDTQFRVAKALVDIPDRGFSVFGNDQLVLMRLDELEQAGIAGPGSRVGHRYFFTGAASQLDEFEQWLKPQLSRDLHRWYSVQDDDSAIGSAVRRAERYFLLASLLAVVLAAVSIGVAAQRYSQRHFDPVAIMKTLGATRGLVQKLYLMQILLVTVVGVIVGLITGFVIQQAVIMALADSVPISLDTWYWRPVGIAVFTGVVCALLFSLYPLLGLFGIPPLRVLRRDMVSSTGKRIGQYIAAGSAIFLLMATFSSDLTLSAILFMSGVVLVLLLMVVSRLLINLGRRLGQGRLSSWQLAWARIKRRAMDNAVQLISFSVTLLLLLVVLVMRNDMVQQWRDQLPDGTSNYFLANLTKAQLPTLQQQLDTYQLENGPVYPMVRGRLTEIAGERVRQAVSKEEESPDNRARAGLGREANLTWASQVQDGNKVIQGTFFSDELGEIPEVSVESGVAERLNIQLGDSLQFDIGGRVIDVKVTSLREVDWQSMRPNFFFVLQPAAMHDFPATYVTSFYLAPERKTELTGLLKPLSSVTLFDIDARINQLREIVDQVSLAVEFILVLVLCAGALVLFAQVQASMDERRQELAILRTLGAKGSLIKSSVIFEFVIVGLVAGMMAAIANEATLYFLQTQVFEMEASMHWQYWLVAPLAGAVIVATLGAVSCWRLLSVNTQQLLRTLS